MISIPLPFVIALLLSILAILLFMRREETTPSAFLFIALCALTITMVGLRWTFDYRLFRFFQPILASSIPATAWYCFANAHKRHRFQIWHLLPPIKPSLKFIWILVFKPSPISTENLLVSPNKRRKRQSNPISQ